MPVGADTDGAVGIGPHMGVNTMDKQPRLRFWLAEFHGIAKSATGDTWWYEQKMDDGTIWRIPLQPTNPMPRSSNRR